MQKLSKYRVAIALLVVCVATAAYSAREYMRVNAFPMDEVVLLPAGVYVGATQADGGALFDPTAEVQNKVARSLARTVTTDAGLFTNSTCNTLGKITVTGAKRGEPCFAGFKHNSAATIGFWPTIVTCEVVWNDVVMVRVCNVGTAIDAGQNNPVTGDVEVRVIGNQ